MKVEFKWILFCIVCMFSLMLKRERFFSGSAELAKAQNRIESREREVIDDLDVREDTELSVQQIESLKERFPLVKQIEVLYRSSRPDDCEVVDDLISEWAKVDFDSAMGWIDETDDLERAFQLKKVAFNAFMAVEPIEALGLLPQVSDLEFRQSLMPRLAYFAGLNDPCLTLAFVREIEDSENRSQAFRRLYDAWVEVDVVAALNHSLTLSDLEMQRDLFGRALRELAFADPQQGMEMMAQIEDPLLAQKGRDLIRQVYSGSNESLHFQSDQSTL